MTWTPARSDVDTETIVARVHSEIVRTLDRTRGNGDDQDALIEDRIARGLRDEHLHRITDGLPPLHPGVEDEVRRRVRQELSPLGPLTRFLTEPRWSDVAVNGAVNTICTERASGRHSEYASPFGSEAHAFEWVAEQAAAAGRRFDEAHPSVRCRLPGGARLHALANVTTLVHLDFRLFLPGLDTLGGLHAAGMFGTDVAAVLAASARLREPFGIVFSGGTGAGKTTLLRAWLNAHPDPVVLDRVVTVEDEQELFLHRGRFRNLVDVEAREANVDGRGEYSTERYLAQDLRRQTPERLAVGELKPDGGVMPLLLALGQGIAQGVATTIHAPSAHDVLSRLRTYAAFGEHQVDTATVMETVAATVDLVVHVARVDGRRVITSIREYDGYRDGMVTSAELWRWDPRAGTAVRTDLDATDRLTEKLAAGGFDVRLLRRTPIGEPW